MDKFPKAYKAYSGIGARGTPERICDRFTKLGVWLEQKGYTLRSGGADGADLAFEWEVTNKEIYLPWKGFNNSTSPLFSIPDRAYEMAEKYHPNWKSLSSAAEKFMARNCMQVLGKNLDTPAEFVVCWTPEAKVWGGTGQAMRMALDMGIPIFNFAKEGDDRKLLDYVL